MVVAGAVMVQTIQALWGTAGSFLIFIIVEAAAVTTVSAQVSAVHVTVSWGISEGPSPWPLLPAAVVLVFIVRMSVYLRNGVTALTLHGLQVAY